MSSKKGGICGLQSGICTLVFHKRRSSLWVETVTLMKFQAELSSGFVTNLPFKVYWCNTLTINFWNQIPPFAFCRKSAQNQIWTLLLFIKKTAATPSFYKQNFCTTPYIGETNTFGLKGERNWNLVSFRKMIVKTIHL